MTMIAKMLKRKVSRVTTEAPDLSAVPGAQGGGDPAQQQTQAASDAAPPHRGHRDSSEGLHRNGSVSLPLQYRQVIVSMTSKNSIWERFSIYPNLGLVLI